MKVLIIGFEPYKKNNKYFYKENPSEKLIKALERTEISNGELFREILPVSFKKVKRNVKKLLHAVKPDYIIMFGYYPKATCFEIEKLAKNWVDTSHDGKGSLTDNDGVSRRGKILNGPSNYETTFPIHVLFKACHKYRIPYKESTWPGTFVCNYTLYYALHEIKRAGFQTKVAFFHIPSFRKPISYPGGLKKKVSIDQVLSCLKYIFLSLS